MTSFDSRLNSDNIILRGAGNDLIDASESRASLISTGSGNDSILLGAGNALVLPGSGDDVVLSNVSSLAAYAEAQGQPFQLAVGPGGGCIMAGIISFGSATIIGGSGPNFIAVSSLRFQSEQAVGVDTATILTGGENDTVITIGTNTLINSGAGDDLLFSGAGDDVIYAGSGNDTVNLRGGAITPPDEMPSSNFLGSSFLSSQVQVQGGGRDTIYLGQGKDTVILNSGEFAEIYGFGSNDRLDLGGIQASFIHRGHDTFVNVSNQAIAVLKGYTGQIKLA